MLKPLIINRCCYFDKSPGGECLRAFLTALENDDWAPVVYASNRNPLVDTIPEYATLTNENSFARYIAAAVRRISVPDLTWLPGYEWQAWGKDAVKQVLKDINNVTITPNYIHSVSYPIASHWAALKIKKATGLPWVMQFYDPWADNPYRPFKTKWLKKKDWEMERLAVESADMIIHDNDIIADIWKNRYGDEVARKIKVLPLTVPLTNSNVRQLEKKKDDKLILSHIGNFSDVRRAKPLIMAVVRLIDKYPEMRCRFIIHFIGDVYEADKELIYHHKLNDVFILHGTIPPSECEAFYNQTDVFISEEGDDVSNRIFFPSKILKYFYYQRPILGITPKGTVLESELKKAGHAIYDNADIDGIVEYLLQSITDYQSLFMFDKEYWHNFEPENIVRQYISFIKEVITFD